MELWIRSQDKKRLVKAKEIYVSDETNKNVPGDILNAEFGFVITNDFDGIGRYETEQRALEVLDEIQELIMNNVTIENNTYEAMDLQLKAYMCSCLCKLYEMPKE